MENTWTDIFALSQFGTGRTKIPYGGRTARIVINNCLQGSAIKITLANRYGKHNVPIDKATFAPCDKDGTLIDLPKTFTFAGSENTQIKAYSAIESDSAEGTIKAGYLAINLLFGKGARINSANMLRERVILSPKGDYTQAESFADANRLTDKLITSAFKLLQVDRCDIIPALESVSISTLAKNKCIVAFGDSITQGGVWSYRLAERLAAPVLNLSIAGNRLLYDCKSLPIIHNIFGKSALKRFEQDVLSRQNAAAVIVALSTNDIGAPGSPAAPKSESVSAEQIIKGLKLLAEKAKAASLAVFFCTLSPFQGYRMGYLSGSEQKRQQVNKWIRTTDEHDGYFDFDQSIRDTKEPTIILPKYDSGDHLHPADNGSLKMANDMDISSLQKLLNK